MTAVRVITGVLVAVIAVCSWEIWSWPGLLAVALITLLLFATGVAYLEVGAGTKPSEEEKT